MTPTQGNDDHSADERLVRRLLQRDSGSSGSHLDEETLAAFAVGALPDAERAAAVEHLSSCDDCRAAAVMLAGADEPAITPVVAASKVRDSFIPWLPLALAAGLLVAVGFWGWNRWDRQAGDDELYRTMLADLNAGKFADVERQVAAAEQAGAAAPRLRNLGAQAARRMTTSLALAAAGRLTDFGMELGGVIARGPAATTGLDTAATLLGTAADRESLLNRGHLELSRHRWAEARVLFQHAVDLSASDADAWLGLGLACYLADDFPSAETAFGQAAELAPQSIEARWNYAMTLEELGRDGDAAYEWRRLLPKLDASDREKVKLHLRSLNAGN